MILTSDPKRLAQILYWHRTGHTGKSIGLLLGLSEARANQLLHKAEDADALRLRRERAKTWRLEVAELVKMGKYTKRSHIDRYIRKGLK